MGEDAVVFVTDFVCNIVVGRRRRAGNEEAVFVCNDGVKRVVIVTAKSLGRDEVEFAIEMRDYGVELIFGRVVKVFDIAVNVAGATRCDNVAIL